MLSFGLRLSVVSRGFAALTPHGGAEGARLANAIAAALSSTLGLPIEIRAGAVPGPPERATGMARLRIHLATSGTDAILEIETRLLAHVLAALCGRPGGSAAALAASEQELGTLAFCALVAVGTARDQGLASLSPLVSLDEPRAAPPAGCLAIQLDLRAGASAGWGRLLVPCEALAAIAGRPKLPADSSTVPIGASLRQGAVTLRPDELAALAPGDVVLLDASPSAAELVLPGGLTFAGPYAAGVHHVEEVRMTETQASYPIVLSVEIARVRVTLGELARLAPGAALPLDIRKDGAVVLRAGEEVVARGALVDVEGGLGVRIAQVGGLR